MTLSKNDRLVKIGNDGKPLTGSVETQIDWRVLALTPAYLGQSFDNIVRRFMEEYGSLNEQFEENGVYQVVLLKKEI